MRWTSVLVLAVAITFAACGEADDSESAALSPDTAALASEAPYVTTPASEVSVPDFPLPTTTDDSLRLTDYRGEVLLVNYWATWCAPCVKEIPGLNELSQELNDRGVKVVGIAFDDGGMEVIKPFAEEMGIRYPIALDDGTVADALGGLYALPTTFVVDPSGRVVESVVGLFPVEEMKEKLIAMAEAQ